MRRWGPNGPAEVLPALVVWLVEWLGGLKPLHR